MSFRYDSEEENSLERELKNTKYERNLVWKCGLGFTGYYTESLVSEKGGKFIDSELRDYYLLKRYSAFWI